MIKEMAQRAREHRLIPEYTESFFKKAYTRTGGKFHALNDGFLSIDSIPFELRRIADEDTFIKSHGTLLKRYPRATFDKEIAFKNPDAEFISFGHPLFEALIAWIEKSLSDSLIKGSAFVDPDGKMDGHILFYEGEVKDGTGEVAGRRIFGFYIGREEIRPVHPVIIWDLEEGAPSDGHNTDVDALKCSTLGYVIPKLEAYKLKCFPKFSSYYSNPY